MGRWTLTDVNTADGDRGWADECGWLRIGGQSGHRVIRLLGELGIVGFIIYMRATATSSRIMGHFGDRKQVK